MTKWPVVRRFSIALVLLGVLGAASASDACLGLVYPAHSQPQRRHGHRAYGVSCSSESVCTAVGDYNKGTAELALAERWTGGKWSIQHTPKPTGGTDISLGGVSCTSKDACTAVGSYYNGTTDVALAERWTGAKWSIQHIPNPTAGTDINLDGVSCTSVSACTAAGHYYNGTTYLTLAERRHGR